MSYAGHKMKKDGQQNVSEIVRVSKKNMTRLMRTNNAVKRVNSERKRFARWQVVGMLARV